MKWEKALGKGQNLIEIPDSWLYLQYYEALTVLFRIENALRVFVFVILKHQFQDKWCDLGITSDDSDQGTIKTIAQKRINQARTHGYLGYPITCPLMYLTGGELIRLITSESYWQYFNSYFLGKKDVIKTKLDEISNIRNSLAHFRPVRQGDVDLVKQNAKHVLVAIEKCIADIIGSPDVVPTNTEEEWYRELKTLGTDICTLSFRQSRDEQWVKVVIEYKCPIIKESTFGSSLKFLRVLNIMSSSILKQYPSLSSYLIYLAEHTPYALIGDDNSPQYTKRILLVFSRKMLAQRHSEIKPEIEQLLLKISEESELIRLDNLARGKLVQSVSAKGTRSESKETTYWDFDTSSLPCEVKEDDPPEFWGDFDFTSEDFVSTTHKYPWMPTTISEAGLPF